MWVGDRESSLVVEIFTCQESRSEIFIRKFCKVAENMFFIEVLKLYFRLVFYLAFECTCFLLSGVFHLAFECTCFL